MGFVAPVMDGGGSFGGVPPGPPAARPVRLDIDPGYFQMPYSYERHRVLRFEAGVVLDLHLRRLCRLSGGVDRALALRLRRLRAGRGYLRLGAARFSDYARERLGLSVRTAQEWVRLGEGLDRLPVLDAALGEGSLTWSAAVLVASVAGVGDEAEWVELARRVSVRELREKVRAALRDRDAAGRRETTNASASSDGGGASGSSEPGDAAGSADDGNAPNSSENVDAASSSGAGDVLDSNQTASAAGSADGGNAADSNDTGAPASDGTQTAAGDVSEELEADPLLRLRVEVDGGTARLWQAACELCEMMAGAPLAEGEVAEYVLADLLSGLVDCVDGDARHHADRPPIHEGWPDHGGLLRRTGLVAELAEEIGEPGLPLEFSEEIAQALRFIDDEVPHDALELDRSMRGLIASLSAVEVDLARMLRIFHSLSLFRHIGFATFQEYVEERLGISVSRARMLLRLDHKLVYFPEIRQALRAGVISTAAAFALFPLGRNLEERTWIERARRRTVARLREEVAWARREQERMEGCSVGPPAAGRLPSELDAVTSELLQQMSAHGAGQGDAAGEQGDWKPAYAQRGWRVQVEFTLRQSAVGLWEEARQRLRQASGEPHVPDRQVLYEAALAFLVAHLPLWLEEVRHGNPIAVRDRFRCQIPGCTKRNGSSHHLWFRSQGGPDDAWNLLFVCPTHHLEVIHRGYLRVSGRVPDHVVFELGVQSGGRVLERFVNEERVVPDVESMAQA